MNSDHDYLMKVQSMKPDLTKLPPGWLTDIEANLLFKYAEQCKGPILEVGCFKGRSTVVLAQTGRQIYSVDPFKNFAKYDPTGDDIEKCFRQNTKDLANVELFVMSIEDWAIRPVGFAYLDGNHTYQGTASQIAVARQCFPTYIAAHDVNDSGGGLHVKMACLDALGPWIERSGRLAIFNNVY